MEQDIADRLDKIAHELSLITNGLEQTIGERDGGILVSCTEAARLLGVTKKTVSMMIRDGRLNKTTIGDSTGIRLSEVREQAAVMR